MDTRQRGATGPLLGLILLFTLQASACATWRPSEVSPRELIEEEQPRLIRVRAAGGASRLVRDPRIEYDAIVFDAECRRSQNPGAGYVCPTETVAALDEVTRVDVRRIAWGRSLILLAGLGYLGWGVAFSLAQ